MSLYSIMTMNLLLILESVMFRLLTLGFFLLGLALSGCSKESKIIEPKDTFIANLPTTVALPPGPGGTNGEVIKRK